MPHVPADTPTGFSNLPRAPLGGESGAGRPPAAMEGRIQWAKDLIAGRIDPQPIVTPRIVEEFLERELAGLDEQRAPDAARELRNALNLQAHYGGQVVALHDTDAGPVVLACGAKEIEALRAGLTAEEWDKIRLHWPPEPLMMK